LRTRQIGDDFAQQVPQHPHVAVQQLSAFHLPSFSVSSRRARPETELFDQPIDPQLRITASWPGIPVARQSGYSKSAVPAMNATRNLEWNCTERLRMSSIG